MNTDDLRERRLSLSEVQDIEYQILSSFAELCDQHGLRYYLAYGTLLGLMRHGDFIPWDDDVDVMMPRPDYDQLRNYKNESNYRLMFPEDDDSLWHFAKMVDGNTKVYEPGVRTQDNYGLFIDIFPLDGIDDMRRAYAAKRRIMLLRAMYRSAYFYNYAESGENIGKRLVKRALTMPSRLRPGHWYKEKVDELASSVAYEHGNKVACYVGGDPLQYEVFDRAELEPPSEIEFRTRTFSAPHNPEAVLTRVYGAEWRTPIVREQHVFAVNRMTCEGVQ